MRARSGDDGSSSPHLAASTLGGVVQSSSFYIFTFIRHVPPCVLYHQYLHHNHTQPHTHTHKLTHTHTQTHTHNTHTYRPVVYTTKTTKRIYTACLLNSQIRAALCFLTFNFYLTSSVSEERKSHRLPRKALHCVCACVRVLMSLE